jgi:hypothetical protein
MRNVINRLSHDLAFFITAPGETIVSHVPSGCQAYLNIVVNTEPEERRGLEPTGLGMSCKIELTE